MEQKNRGLFIVLPLLLAVFVVIGIYVGLSISPRKDFQLGKIVSLRQNAAADKLGNIVSYINEH